MKISTLLLPIGALNTLIGCTLAVSTWAKSPLGVFCGGAAGAVAFTIGRLANQALDRMRHQIQPRRHFLIQASLCSHWIGYAFYQIAYLAAHKAFHNHYSSPLWERDFREVNRQFNDSNRLSQAACIFSIGALSIALLSTVIKRGIGLKRGKNDTILRREEALVTSIGALTGTIIPYILPQEADVQLFKYPLVIASTQALCWLPFLDHKPI